MLLEESYFIVFISAIMLSLLMHKIRKLISSLGFELHDVRKLEYLAETKANKMSSIIVIGCHSL